MRNVHLSLLLFTALEPARFTAHHALQSFLHKAIQQSCIRWRWFLIFLVSTLFQQL